MRGNVTFQKAVRSMPIYSLVFERLAFRGVVSEDLYLGRVIT